MLKPGGRFVGMTTNPYLKNQKETEKFAKGGCFFSNPKGYEALFQDEDTIKYKKINKVETKLLNNFFQCSVKEWP